MAFEMSHLPIRSRLLMPWSIGLIENSTIAILMRPSFLGEQLIFEERPFLTRLSSCDTRLVYFEKYPYAGALRFIQTFVVFLQNVTRTTFPLLEQANCIGRLWWLQPQMPRAIRLKC